MEKVLRPDIVVGIDIGQTCSGVAYSIGPDWSEPRTLQHWPSTNGVEKADKVATRVGYDKSTSTLVSWGFQSTFGDDNIQVYEQFKLTLDADYEDDRGYTCEQARGWYGDYLRCLHGEIVSFFEAAIPTWRKMNIEYSFSTPTTWNNPAMIASIEKIAKSAGFEDAHQTIRMALTEAEAAAIEASITEYKSGQIFLICDAGGGTTDVNLLRVESTKGRIALEPLDYVEGAAIGSTLIDFRMAEHIVDRLELIKDHLDGDVYSLSEEMLMDRFQTIKHSFPRPLAEFFYLDVKGLSGALSFPEAGIKDGRMSINRATLKDIFDAQIGEIFTLIDEKLLALQDVSPQEEVSYIVLSGGFGSSPYLYEQIQERYEMKAGFQSGNTANIRIMRVLEPQLTVVRGLVRDRTQTLGSPTTQGQEVFETRRCRNSYGTIVREPYREAAHLGMPYVTDPHDGRRWVESMIDWFIKRGERIQVGEGIRRHYGATLSEAEARQSRKAQIVMSGFPIDRLPMLATDQGCKKVATVDYKLTDNDMKLKNRQVWKLKKKYWKADFSFVTMLGAADLRFQISGMNGILSSGHDSLRVEFEDSTEPAPSSTVNFRTKSRRNRRDVTGQSGVFRKAVASGVGRRSAFETAHGGVDNQGDRQGQRQSMATGPNGSDESNSSPAQDGQNGRHWQYR